MREEKNSINLDIPRPESAVSSQSGRSSKQALVRSYDLAKFQRQTIITPLGFRTTKIYLCPEAERNALDKYKQRPRTALGIMTTKKETNNNNLSPPDGRLLKRASSAKQPSRTFQTELKSQSSRPSTASSATTTSSRSSASSNQSIVFNSRHPACSPPHLYRQDELRAEARRNHPKSATCVCCEGCNSSTDKRRRRAKSADVVRRFGVPVVLPDYVKTNKFLRHEDLDMGQKQYIWGMAKVYSVEQLKYLKQRQYNTILNYEYMKRVMSKGMQETDRIKLSKEYIEYQKFIERFGKDGCLTKNNSQCSKYLRTHGHAKKHRIVGWTMDFDGEYNDSFDSSSLKDTATTSDESHTDSEAVQSYQRPGEGERGLPRPPYRDRPRSSKYKTRKKEFPRSEDQSLEDTRQIIGHSNEHIDESLAADVQDRLNIEEETEDNFI
eukprot:gene11775-12994_t